MRIRPCSSAMLGALALALAFAGCRTPAPAPPPSAWRAEAWPAADALFHRDPRWLGADAAWSVDLGGERVLWLFGDTFVATSDRCVRRESKMVRNTIAVQRGRDPTTAAIAFHWRDGPGSWLPEDGEHWYWPQAGIRLANGPLVLFWSTLVATPGEGLGFRCVGFCAIAIDNADDEPPQWRIRALPQPPAPPGLVFALGLHRDGAFVQGFALREPGDHAACAFRIDADALAHGDLARGELWCGDGWRQLAADQPVVPVLADAGAELSLHFDERLQQFVSVRSLGFGASDLAAATAPRLTGPWSSPRPFFRPEENARPRPFVYAGKAHPELLGADLVATYATNSFDFGELVTDDTLYWPRFVRVTFAAH